MILNSLGDGYRVASGRQAPPVPRYLAYRQRTGGLLGLLGNCRKYYVSSPSTIMVVMRPGRARQAVCSDLARHFAVETDGGVLTICFGGADAAPVPGDYEVAFDQLSEQTLAHRAEPLLRAGGTIRLAASEESTPVERTELLTWLAARLRGFSARTARPILVVLKGLEPAFSARRLGPQLQRAHQDLAMAAFSQVVVLDPAAVSDPGAVLASDLTFYDDLGLRADGRRRLLPPAFPEPAMPASALVPLRVARGGERHPRQRIA